MNDGGKEISPSSRLKLIFIFFFCSTSHTASFDLERSRTFIRFFLRSFFNSGPSLSLHSRFQRLKIANARVANASAHFTVALMRLSLHLLHWLRGTRFSTGLLFARRCREEDRGASGPRKGSRDRNHSRLFKSRERP